MDTKIIVVLALTIIAVALVVLLVVYINKLGKAISDSNFTFAQRILDVIKAVAVTIAVIVGGAAAGSLMTSCVAKRSITVQGTVIQSATSDSTRIIISSQESYSGVKK